MEHHTSMEAQRLDDLFNQLVKLQRSGVDIVDLLMPWWSFRLLLRAIDHQSPANRNLVHHDDSRVELEVMMTLKIAARQVRNELEELIATEQARLAA